MEAIVSFVTTLAAGHPWLSVVVTVAGFIVLAQPVLRAIVRWTPNKVDDKVAEVVFKIANLLTPKKVQRGEKVAAPPAPPQPHPETHALPVDPSAPTEN